MLRPLLLVVGAQLLLLLCTAPVPAAAKRVTVSNVLPRLDSEGRFINAHDGGLYEFDGVYHLYGTVYAHCHQPGPTCDGECGYYNNTFSLYTSPDLVQWTLVSLNVLPAMTVDHATVPYWMANVAYNPRTQLYMMQYWDNKVHRTTHSQATTDHAIIHTIAHSDIASLCLWLTVWQYGFTDSRIAMASSNSSHGPFVPIEPITLRGASVISSTTGFFVDPHHNGWVRVNTRDEPLRHVVELLNANWTDTTGKFRVVFEKESYPWLEGGGMMWRDGLYYVMLGSDCCFCQWGGSARVFVTKDPLGEWTEQGDVNYCADGLLSPDQVSNGTVNPCSLDDVYGTNFTIPAQQFNLFQLRTANGTLHVYFGERFRSADSGWKDEDYQAWIPLSFTANGTVRPMQWVDEWEVDLSERVESQSAVAAGPLVSVAAE